MVRDTDIAWLAGIIDGEGCFSVKHPVGYDKHLCRRKTYQVWLVVCNTSERMIRRVANIVFNLTGFEPSVRRVNKGDKAKRPQFWVSVARKRPLLVVTRAILPYLVNKHLEGAVVEWVMRRVCADAYHTWTLEEAAVLELLHAIKLNSGEAPADVMRMLREVIPSEALEGPISMGGSRERVEARRVTPKNNPAQECPATRDERVGDMVQSSGENRSAGINDQRRESN